MFKYEIDENIELRSFLTVDASDLFNLTDCNRDALQEWLPWIYKTNEIKDTELFIHHALEQEAAKKGFFAAIYYQRKIAGVIDLHRISAENRDAEVGYWLGKDFTGCGIMTKACAAIINYAFNTMQLNRLTLFAGTENAKSRAIAERLGFQLEGTQRQAEWVHDHFIDLALYGLLAKEWQDKK